MELCLLYKFEVQNLILHQLQLLFHIVPLILKVYFESFPERYRYFITKIPKDILNFYEYVDFLSK